MARVGVYACESEEPGRGGHRGSVVRPDRDQLPSFHPQLRLVYTTFRFTETTSIHDAKFPPISFHPLVRSITQLVL